MGQPGPARGSGSWPRLHGAVGQPLGRTLVLAQHVHAPSTSAWHVAVRVRLHRCVEYAFRRELALRAWGGIRGAESAMLTSPAACRDVHLARHKDHTRAPWL